MGSVIKFEPRASKVQDPLADRMAIFRKYLEVQMLTVAAFWTIMTAILTPPK